MIGSRDLGDRLRSRQTAIAPRVHQRIQLVRTSNGQPRAIAVQRLETIRAADGLDDATWTSYVDALWAQVNKTAPIPNVQGFPLALALRLPNAVERMDDLPEFSERAKAPEAAPAESPPVGG